LKLQDKYIWLNLHGFRCVTAKPRGRHPLTVTVIAKQQSCASGSEKGLHMKPSDGQLSSKPPLIATSGAAEFMESS